MKVIHARGHFGASSVSPPSLGQNSIKGTETGAMVRGLRTGKDAPRAAVDEHVLGICSTKLCGFEGR